MILIIGILENLKFFIWENFGFGGNFGKKMDHYNLLPLIILPINDTLTFKLLLHFRINLQLKMRSRTNYSLFDFK